MARKPAKKKTTVSVNFKGVQSRQLLPEDDYRVKLTEATQEESNSGNDQIVFVFAVNDGTKFDGQKLWFHCPLTENSLWKLHGLLTAMGVEVPDDELELDLEEMVEAEHELMAVVQHETYDGTKRSKMMDFYAIEEEKDEPKGKSKKDADEGDDEKPAKGKKARGGDDGEDDAAAKRKARRAARKAKASGDEDEKPAKGKKSKKEPEKLAKSDVEEMDRDALEELIQEHDLDVDADDHKKDAKLLAAVLAELEEKDLLEEEEEEPEEKPAKGKKGADKKGKKPPKLTTDEVQGMDEDELGEVIEKYELSVDLDDYKTLRKKAAAVIDALEDADMIEGDND